MGNIWSQSGCKYAQAYNINTLVNILVDTW